MFEIRRKNFVFVTLETEKSLNETKKNLIIG